MHCNEGEWKTFPKIFLKLVRMNEEQSKVENFSMALSEHQIESILSNFVNAWETQRYNDGHDLIGG